MIPATVNGKNNSATQENVNLEKKAISTENSVNKTATISN